ncbi:hypothetical protein [Sphingomonas astaxanthinifaciens]|uniref:Uncharacterized protein n=1 Tax=Sphingomonas astaxanthinifaciens DSM 22298 TaxID=1123267 RepID=A0ABQ5Z0U1_9SPHN|nr:hypothetical protein [Sphingomonas astaxanthinifaciens]GLR46378.1 hypothetical protein GCM10007925_00890 [Sphingomonas astaxanthinifaciens DSM 22298]
MTKFSFVTGLAATALLASGAAAQWVPGSEIAGQTLQVETNGIVNNITFQPGGTATITTPSGQAIPASWTAGGGQLCLRTGAASECFPYTQAFQAGQSVTATSSCGATSRWLANATNQPMQPARSAGERG